MDVFEVGKVVLKEKIDGDVWSFFVSDVFHLSSEEYAKNEAYNDTLGNYEPDKELPTNSVVTIVAISSAGEKIELKWSSSAKGVYPHTRQRGWSKGLFVKLNVILRKWRFPNA